MIADGRRVTVPAGIGLDYRDRCVTALYTSDSSGIVRVDSDAGRNIFTFGQFFDEWQVALAAHRLAGLGGSIRGGSWAPGTPWCMSTGRG